MNYDPFEQKRKDKKKFLRLKIITNREFNFITAVRPNSTITDLANRALNAYLQLSQQNRSKKQLTISAVKQGRYFMPKSEIVSNLLSQDEEVQIIIVKAKPKFPEQQIPTQHDFEVLKKKIKNFDESISRKNLTLSSQLYKKSLNINSYQSEIQLLNKPSQSSSDNNSILSKTHSKSSQIQRSKRERKNKKRQQRKLKNQKKIQEFEALHKQNNNYQENIQSVQNQIERTKKIFINNPVVFNGSVEDFIKEKQLSPKKRNQYDLSLKNSKSIDRSIEKDEKQKVIRQSVQSIQSVQSVENAKRDFSLSLKSQPSQEKIQQLRKKVKIDHTAKFPFQQVSRKGSVEARSQRTPKINPVQSPKVIFHFETKHESPKILYIPQSKSMSEMKENIQKEKQKIKSMSPIMLPKSSPKISVLQDPYEKSNQSIKSLLNTIIKKNKYQGGEIKSSIHHEEQIDQIRKDKQILKCNRQSSPKLSNHPSNPVSNSSGVFMQQRRIVKQPQIIEQQSSEEEKMNNQKTTNQILKFKQSQKDLKLNRTYTNPVQSSEPKTKKKVSTSSKYFEIQNLINKFKLEQSDEENS